MRVQELRGLTLGVPPTPPPAVDQQPPEAIRWQPQTQRHVCDELSILGPPTLSPPTGLLLKGQTLLSFPFSPDLSHTPPNHGLLIFFLCRAAHQLPSSAPQERNYEFWQQATFTLESFYCAPGLSL